METSFPQAWPESQVATGYMNLIAEVIKIWDCTTLFVDPTATDNRCSRIAHLWSDLDDGQCETMLKTKDLKVAPPPG